MNTQRYPYQAPERKHDAYGVKGVRSGLVWELVRDNPNTQIDLRLAVE